MEEGRIESCTEVSSDMETCAALETEKLRKELEEEKKKNEQLSKTNVEKDNRIAELEINQKDEATKNAQSQYLKDLQIEQQHKQLIEKEERIKEIEKENAKLESQVSDKDVTIKSQRQNIDASGFREQGAEAWLLLHAADLAWQNQGEREGQGQAGGHQAHG